MIPNPYPNIKDLDLSDNKTLSSSKITALLAAKQAQLEDIYNTELEQTSSGAVMSFKTAVEKPIRGTFQIDPTLDGVSAVNVVRCGKNLFTSVGSESGYYLNANGVKISDANWMLSDYIEVPSNATLYFNPNSNSGSGAKHALYDSTKTFITYADSGAGSFTTPSNCKYIRFSYRSVSTDIQLEVGSSATAYTAYVTPITRTISLGQTVYGGSVSVSEGGEVIIDVTHNSVDLGSLTWIQLDNGVFRANVSDGLVIITTNITDILCDDDFTVKPSDNSAKWASDDKVIWHGTGSYCYLYATDSSQESADDFTTSVSGVYVTYPLATPTTSELTDIDPIETLVGENNIWADTGSGELVYMNTIRGIIENNKEE